MFDSDCLSGTRRSARSYSGHGTCCDNGVGPRMITAIGRFRRSVVQSEARVDLKADSVPVRSICLFLAIVLLSSVVLGQYQQAPPDLGGSSSFPTPQHPEPRADWLRGLDVVLLAAALAAAAWL